MISLKYKGKPITVIKLGEVPACEVSLSTVRRNLRRGDSPEDAVLVTQTRKAYSMKKRGRNGRIGFMKNPPKKSELPEYSTEEALAIMLIPVNPDKSRYHNFGVMNDPMNAIRRRSRIR